MDKLAVLGANGSVKFVIEIVEHRIRAAFAGLRACVSVLMFKWRPEFTRKYMRTARVAIATVMHAATA